MIEIHQNNLANDELLQHFLVFASTQLPGRDACLQKGQACDVHTVVVQR